MEQNQKAETKAKIAELQNKYERLRAICSYGARISKETMESYARQISQLTSQLN